MKPRGHHMLINCKSCDKQTITDPIHIKKFIKELVQAIDMKAYGEPIIEHFALQTPQLAGYTLIQLIETSSITAHFCDESGDAYIDVFSCKTFGPNIVLQCIKKFFQPQNYSHQLIQRGVHDL